MNSSSHATIQFHQRLKTTDAGFVIVLKQSPISMQPLPGAAEFGISNGLLESV